MAGYWMAGSAVVGAGASLMSADKNSSAQENATAQQVAMQRQQLDFQKQQYNRYLGLFGGTEQNLANQANSSQPLFYDQNAAAIKSNYGNTLRNVNQSMGMRGMAGSGIDAGALRGAASGQAGALSSAYNQGMQNRMNLGLSLTGRGQIQNAAAGVGNSMQGMANVYGQQAGMYGNAAMMAGQGVANSMNQFSQGMGQYNMMNYLRGMNTPQGSGWNSGGWDYSSPTTTSDGIPLGGTQPF